MQLEEEGAARVQAEKEAVELAEAKAELKLTEAEQKRLQARFDKASKDKVRLGANQS
jgi:hypothetical protein